MPSECMKQSSSSFLDKFKGKTTKISKKGVNPVLYQKVVSLQKPQTDFYSLQSGRDVNSDSNPKKQLQKDMDELFELNPEYLKNKRKISHKLSPLQHEYTVVKPERRNKNILPPIYTPEKIYKRDVPSKCKSYIESKSEEEIDFQPSLKSEKKRKYVFGKYLKLDNEAMKHFQFLKSVEKKSLFKDNSKIISH